MGKVLPGKPSEEMITEEQVAELRVKWDALADRGDYAPEELEACLDTLEVLWKVVKLADHADLGHGPSCLAMAKKPCTCGLDELDVALADLESA